MIKAVAHNEAGSKILILGLSTANLEKLQEGKPIAFPTTELEKAVGFEMIVILWGDTEQEIVEAIRKDWPGPGIPPKTVRKDRS